MQGELAALACSKHGSRSLDAIWRRSSAKAREWIAAELAEKEAALNANQFGRFFAQKCALSTFKRAKGDWARVRLQSQAKCKIGLGASLNIVGKISGFFGFIPLVHVSRNLLTDLPYIFVCISIITP